MLWNVFSFWQILLITEAITKCCLRGEPTHSGHEHTAHEHMELWCHIAQNERKFSQLPVSPWCTEWPRTTTEEQEWVMEFQTRASTNCSMEEAQQIMKEDSVGYYFVDYELCTPLLQSWPFRSELLSYNSQPRENHGPGCGIPQG